MDEAREFNVPPKIIAGPGARKSLGEQSARLGGKKALIVTDRKMVQLGGFAELERSLEAAGIGFAVYADVVTEPTVDYVSDGLAAYREANCDFLVACGGGSPIDTAKAIRVMEANPGNIEDYMGAGKVARRGAPLLAVPTTAGTGSEVTQFTVITDTRTQVKMLIASPWLIPDVAIVDPELTLTCPAFLTANVAVDALTHAIEAYVSVKAQPMSDIFCLSAVRLITGNLRAAWSDGSDLAARSNVMLGALQAGIAFSNSSVALVHGMSRPIGAYFHVAHGASNAVLLDTVTRFSLEGNPGRYARLAEAMGEDVAGLADMAAAERAADAVGRLIRDVRIPSLRDLGVEEARLRELAPQMARDAIASGSPANNPRAASQEEIVSLYLRAFQSN